MHYTRMSENCSDIDGRSSIDDGDDNGCDDESDFDKHAGVYDGCDGYGKGLYIDGYGKGDYVRLNGSIGCCEY